MIAFINPGTFVWQSPWKIYASDQSSGAKMKKPFLALVDHGTPVFGVHRVREEVGKELKERMKDYVSGFSTCSMERRDGVEYDFNEPLLENLLVQKKGECEEMLVAQLFLSPGRHAGEGGDLDRICSAFAGSSPSRRLVRTDLLGTHPSVVEILADRIERIGLRVENTD